MGEAKFTPGPWQSQHQWDADGIYSIIGGIDGPDDGRFHYTHVCEVNEECRDAYANVALIAAAPDLYEALQRIVAAFPPEVQGGICSQLADCLVAVVAQRLVYRNDLGMLVPECEILMASSATKGVIRQGQFFKLGTVLEGGGQDGSWSFARYREWLAAKTDWSMPEAEPIPVEAAPKAAEPLPLPKPAAVKKAKPPPGVMEIEDGDDLADILAQLDRKG